MWNSRSIILSLFIGLLNGIVLGLILKSIEHFTNIGVYTLLLNVDFIPIFGSHDWSETTEFFFHVFISIVITFVFVNLAQRFKLGKYFKQLMLLSFLICLPTFILYFILSELAIKEVPIWYDWKAFTYWSVGHFMYVWTLAFLYKKLI
ncbi:MAG: hypothetical protein ACE3JQ_07310 [Paenisporosarcina sp.]